MQQAFWWLNLSNLAADPNERAPKNSGKTKRRQHRCEPQRWWVRKKHIGIWRRRLWRRLTKKRETARWKTEWKAVFWSEMWILKFVWRSVSSTSIISNTPLHHRLSTDGFIHLTWQQTAPNCFGGRDGSKLERKRGRNRKRQRKRTASASLCNSELVMIDPIKDQY